MRSSSETQALFDILRQSTTPAAAGAIEALVREGSDRALCRVNALDFAATRGLNEEEAIAAFLHAARLGLFELAWNVLCPGCGGVLDTGATLKNVDREEYTCTLCAAGYEPTLDEMVEVTFTVSPNVRRIAAHDPHTLPVMEFYRQVFWGSGIDLPDDETLARDFEEITLDSLELPPGEKASMSLQAPEAFLIVIDPVVHLAQFIEVTGEPTRERQTLSAVLTMESPGSRVTIRPGPLRILFENRTSLRTLPSVWIGGDKLHGLMSKRRPFLTAKRLLTNQTFRDLYRTDTLDVDQRLKITSLTFLFTDLKGSTELYDRVGDLVAYDLVKAHFRALHEIVAAEGGAVVKTIGDAVMATFPSPDRAVAAALRMRAAMRDLGADLILKIGIHEGPCLAVMLNERQDYFGQTVNIASRVQGLATSPSIFATGPVVSNSRSAEILEEAGIIPSPKEHSLRGIAEKMAVFEIP
ncbi:adenylate/guanylate cyclase domain-containing protein [Methylocapsa sp. S129]|uniref:adenylate/guanylate cyclase domain-containing protein n=1 Tax=Methylocapsa sp. S129 TaxID=1641869 RepID=UPI00131E94AB|nr:adenylate/guanylate cyclase domain-containing protein [Methylocapsa sp. S129]